MAWIQNVVARYVSDRRRGSWLLYRMARVVVGAYNNGNVDITTNGELWVQRVLLSRGPVVAFDVGANLGQWSQLLLSNNLDAVIYAFEPIPAICAILKANISSSRLISVNAGLSASDRIVQMSYRPDRPDESTLNDWSAWTDTKPQNVKIQLLQGDEFCRERQIDRITYLKIDAEGHDLEVIRGMRETIEAGKINFIQFEYNFQTLRGGASLREFFEFLTDKYVIGRILPSAVELYHYHPMLDDFSQANFLAIRRHLLTAQLVRSLRLRLPQGLLGQIARTHLILPTSF